MLDGRGNILRDVMIEVEGTKITRVDTGGVNNAAPIDYELGDQMLLPGLIDAHVHLAWYFNEKGKLHTDNDGETPTSSLFSALGNAGTTLVAGFTTVQSPGSRMDKEVREWIATHPTCYAPRILTSLEPLDDHKLTPEQLRQAVRERKLLGADLIKIFASGSIREGGAATMTAVQLEAICGEAKVQGLHRYGLL